MKTKLVEHVPRINIMHLTCMTYVIWHHDIMTKNHLWDYTWKQKLFSMSQGLTLSILHHDIWHHDIMTWQIDKQSLLRLHMKTKVVQHVPRINIIHLTWAMSHDIITWQIEKQSLLRLHMKTTVDPSVPVINLWQHDMTAWQTIINSDFWAYTAWLDSMTNNYKQ